MGRSHALSGVAVGMGTASAHALPLAQALIPALPVGQALLVAAVCGGAAVLPDIDHPDASVSKTFGPATWLLALIVGKAFGGHRNGTHSALGCALMALAAFGATALHTGDADIAMLGLGCAAVILATALPVRLFAGTNGQSCYKTVWGGMLAVGFVGFVALTGISAALAYGKIVGTIVLGVLILLALSALARAARIPGKWDELAALGATWLAVAPEPWRAGLPEVNLRLMPWALTVGVVVHCLGDSITRGGIPWAWPLTQVNVGLKLIDTNGPVEHKILVRLFVLAIGAGLWVTVAPLVGIGGALSLFWLLSETKATVKKKRKSGRRPSGKRAVSRAR